MTKEHLAFRKYQSNKLFHTSSLRLELHFSSTEMSSSPAGQQVMESSDLPDRHTSTFPLQDAQAKPICDFNDSSLLHFVNTTYQRSSVSLADTQFSDDPVKFDWKLSSGCAINQGAAIVSRPHIPHSRKLYYLSKLGDPSHNPNDASASVPRQDPRLLDEDAFTSAAETARPDWRTDAWQSRRAGSFFDYSLAPDHLRDRLFFQGFVIPSDAALQGATTAAIQDFEAVGKENEVLKENIEAKLERVRQLKTLVREQEARVEAVRREIRWTNESLGKTEYGIEVSRFSDSSDEAESDVSDTF
jgi:hypothetical protein